MAARAAAVDELIVGLWTQAVAETPALGQGIAVLAVGGYGRRELFPYSDVDLLYLLDGKVSEAEIKQPLRRISQQLWDCGIRLAPATRRRSEAERFDAENAEFTIALLDHRLLAGDAEVYRRLAEVGFPKMLERENKALAAGLVKLTDERHAKYGDTPFHLEPSIKDCPGGLRDVHVCAWLERLEGVGRPLKTRPPQRAKRCGPRAGEAVGERRIGERQGGVSPGGGVSVHGALFSALPARAGRQYAGLAGAGRGGGSGDRIGAATVAVGGAGRNGGGGGGGVLDAASTSATRAAWSAAWPRCWTGRRGSRVRGRWTASAKAAFSRGRRGAEAAAAGFRVTGGRLALDGATAAGDPAAGPGRGAATVCGDGADGLRAGARERASGSRRGCRCCRRTWRRGRRCGGTCRRYCWGSSRARRCA